MQNLISYSPFLSKIREKNPDADQLIPDDICKNAKVFESGSTAELMAFLRRSRESIAYATAAADLAGKMKLGEVTGCLSDFADTCIQTVLRHLLKRYHHDGKICLIYPDDPFRDCSIFVLALGKLGAFELNYSSDIDLIVFYDERKILTPDASDQPQIFIRIVRDLVRIMEERTPDGYVFRTDLRLRPDATPLAVSLSAAETYYGSFGQNWERAAMIKARPVAGDMQAAAEFMKIAGAWIWRKNLDFAAIQDIHSIKRQINAHRNLSPDALKKENLLGHNIKLGRGGIREIEFFVQTQQLIFGGRDPRLRTSGTMQTLSQLHEIGHITAETTVELSHAYVFLRETEHRLQMIDDRQTHSLPETSGELEKFAKFMGFADTAGFLGELRKHLLNVERSYATLFEDSPSLAAGPGNLVFTGTEDDPETLATLHKMGFENVSQIAATIRGWHHGRYRAMRSERARQLLTELVPTFLEAFGKSPDADAAFLRFDRFLASLPSGIPIFSFFYQNPQMLGLLAEIMGAAPQMAEHLNVHPEVLEGVVSNDFFGPLPECARLAQELDRMLETARDYEHALDITRRWTRDKQFHAGVHVIKGLTDAALCGPFLSDIADLALSSLLPFVEKDFTARHGKIPGGQYALLGLGRLGGQDLAFASDLDLIAVYDAPESAEAGAYYARLTRRLITALTAPTAEGKLFEVDMRLRPHGNDGPLAISLEGFDKYYKNEAWTWELMSLTRARPVAGDEKLQSALRQSITAALTRPQDEENLRKDILEMRQKIAGEFGRNDPWDLKNRHGGLTDILFAVQFLLLKHAAQNPELLSTRLDEVIEKLGRVKLVNDLKPLAEMLSYARRAQNFLRLSARLPFRPEEASPALKQSMAKAVLLGAQNPSFLEMETQLTHAADAADAYCRDILQFS